MTVNKGICRPKSRSGCAIAPDPWNRNGGIGEGGGALARKSREGELTRLSAQVDMLEEELAKRQLRNSTYL